MDALLENTALPFIILNGFFAVLGLIFLFMGLRTLVYYFLTKRWTLISARMDDFYIERGAGPQTLVATVKYVYIFNDVEYAGEFTMADGDPERLNDKVRQFVSVPINVRVNPNNPSQSTYRSYIGTVVYLSIVAGMVFLVPAVLTLYGIFLIGTD